MASIVQENNGLALLNILQENSILENIAGCIPDFTPGNYCIVAFGIEHFRLYNKWFGRKQGDELLGYIAKALEKLYTEEGVIIGNVNADNFYFIAPNIYQTIDKCVFFLKEEMAKNQQAKDFRLIFGAYVLDNAKETLGIAYDDAKSTSYNFIDNATSDFGWYSSDMENAEEELKQLPAIRKALAESEFVTYFQPKCNLATGKIIGSEALVRWLHPKKGNILPHEFLPLMERNGYITKLDQYVWESVCFQLRRWLDNGLKPLPVSVNISRMDFESMDVCAFFENMLRKYNLPTELLELEITESAFVENTDIIAKEQTKLKALGLKILIDDFGSGYSSLNMLKDIQADIIKLDIKFLDLKPSNMSKGIEIINSVIAMAHHLGMPIIVEGVETHEQARILLQAGCHYCQGFRFYKPMPVEAFERYLTNESYLERSNEIDKLKSLFEVQYGEGSVNKRKAEVEAALKKDIMTGVMNIVDSIVRVNLTTGNFRVIKIGQIHSSHDNIPSNFFNLWKQALRKGLVHPEDTISFLHFGNQDYLRNAIKNNETISVTYHRKFDEEYGLVKVFVTRCHDYSETSETVIFSMLRI